QIFINKGFTLKEIIIKEQLNCSLINYWKEKSKQLNFYLLALEYIFVLYNKERILYIIKIFRYIKEE
ncbi:MAG: hypothetical protein RSC65_04330, partial [Malacoplasma sp.]